MRIHKDLKGARVYVESSFNADKFKVFMLTMRIGENHESYIKDLINLTSYE